VAAKRIYPPNIRGITVETEKFSYIKGIVALLVMIAVNYILWRIFFAPSNGIFKLFTPMYGLALVVTFFFVLITLSDTFYINAMKNSLVKGLSLLILICALFYVLFYVFFWNFLGKFGIAYFSPHALIAAGGTGAEIWNMRENSSMAILYLMTSLIFVTTAWNVGFGSWPWNQNGTITQGVSKFFAISFFGVILYSVLFHPHITALFVPKQVYVGVNPWWENVAMTSSAFYHLGWIFAAIFVFLLTEITFEGWPWRLLKTEGQGNLASGLTAIVISVAVGLGLMYLMEVIMNYFWYEPFTGGNYTDDPRFRHLHVAEASSFFILVLLILKTYFNNLGSRMNPVLNYLLRFVLVLGGGMLFWWFYYSETIGPLYVNRVPGIGNVDATSLCWTIMSISIVLVHEKLFDALPQRKN
jgi:AAT family amino acid transporter